MENLENTIVLVSCRTPYFDLGEDYFNPDNFHSMFYVDEQGKCRVNLRALELVKREREYVLCIVES